MVFRSQRQEREHQQKVVDRYTQRAGQILRRRESLAAEARSLEATIAECQSLELDKILLELEATRSDLTLQLNQISSRLSTSTSPTTREKVEPRGDAEPSYQRVKTDLENAELRYEEDRSFIQNGRRDLDEVSKKFAELDAQLQKVLDSSTNSQPDHRRSSTQDQAAERRRGTRAERSAHQHGEGDLLAPAVRALHAGEGRPASHAASASTATTTSLEVFEGSDQLLSQVEFEYEALARSVNKSAEREYAAVYDSYRHLSQSASTSWSSERTSIVRFIENIDSEKKKVFMTAFETINSRVRGYLQAAHQRRSVARAGEQGGRRSRAAYT